MRAGCAGTADLSRSGGTRPAEPVSGWGGCKGGWESPPTYVGGYECRGRLGGAPTYVGGYECGGRFGDSTDLRRRLRGEAVSALMERIGIGVLARW